MFELNHHAQSFGYHLLAFVDVVATLLGTLVPLGRVSDLGSVVLAGPGIVVTVFEVLVLGIEYYHLMVCFVGPEIEVQVVGLVLTARVSSQLALASFDSPGSLV